MITILLPKMFVTNFFYSCPENFENDLKRHYLAKNDEKWRNQTFLVDFLGQNRFSMLQNLF